MELNHHLQLQFLADRTWDLQVQFEEKINQDRALNFCCRRCSNYGGRCAVEEREKMFAINDSLKDLHTILISLQRLESCKNGQRNEALARLEESRVLLIERINQCTEKERKLEVVQELATFLGDGKNAKFSILNFDGKMDEKIDQKSVNGISSFVVSTAKIAMEFVVAFASIYSTVRLYNSRQRSGEVVSPTDSRMLPIDSNIHIDVWRGRG